MTSTSLAAKIEYSGKTGSVAWEGRCVKDAAHFKSFVQDVVRLRVADTESSFDADLRGLVTTGMGTEFVERLLKAVPEPKDWEVGEALAECVLQSNSGREVHWPWNTVRDRRTPRASLPGADLVGFYRNGEAVTLLFGEVKTSSDAGTPPNVMYGGSGMTWQLEESATRLDIQHTLLKWLYSRCQSALHRELYEKAVRRYLESGGKELLLVGVLIRDTQPSELDVENRAKVLAKKLPLPTRIEIVAWYLPVSIGEWPQLLREEVS
ncbi:MAG: hypothetical protein ACYCQK_03015 [Acidiferrobacteraceae bacterium]